MDHQFNMGISYFLENEGFLRWIIRGDKEQEDYWNDWINKNPSRREDFEAAIEFMKKIHAAQQPALPDYIGKELWEKIKNTITGQEVIEIAPARTRIHWWWAAASILLIVSGLFYFLPKGGKVKNDVVASKGLEMKKTDAANIERINKSTSVQTIYLADGTKVILEPGGSLINLALFNKEKREVYLSGNAFFEVAKDASRPFYVYAGGIVTKVLGTSFRVRAMPGENKVLVAVRTGKVSVNSQKNLLAGGNNGIVLLPSQQAVFNTDQNILVQKAVTDTALICRPAIPVENFMFDNEKVSTIFDKLARVYSIEIVYDKQIFSKCLITTSLENESLYDKLWILCDAIGATFTIADNQIKIEGKGCN